MVQHGMPRGVGHGGSVEVEPQGRVCLRIQGRTDGSERLSYYAFMGYLVASTISTSILGPFWR